jgi:hypothetical protein
MRKYKTLFGAALCLAAGTIPSLAQNFCGEVLKYAARNYTTDSRQNSIAKNTYDRYCSGDKSSSTSQFSIGIDAVLEEIPIGFKLGSGSTQERLSTFCRLFSEDFRAHSSKYAETNLIAPESVKAWSECVKLYGEGVSFNPIISTTQTTVVIEKKSADPIDVQGVQFDSAKLACSVPDTNTSAIRADADMNTKKKLLSGGAWQVSCDRKPAGSTDSPTYPQADLSIHTSKGTFALQVPADAVIGPQSATAINQQINNILLKISKPDQIECSSTSAESPVTKSPTVQARIPQSALIAGYSVVAGGCELSGPEPGQAGGRPHNGPITASRPTGDGWHCRAMDPPNIPLNYSVRAWAVYCRNIAAN